MKEWERQEMKCPWDISPQGEKESWRAKVKDCCSGIKSKPLLYLPASRQKQQQSLSKEQETPQEMRQRDREEGVSYHWVRTSESDQESVQLAFDCWQMCRLSLWGGPIINHRYFPLCSLEKLWLDVDICYLVGELLRDSPNPAKEWCL